MKEKVEIILHLCDWLEQLRQEVPIPVTQQCKDSNVSTRTYAKIKKRQPVKVECYVRICKGPPRKKLLSFGNVLGSGFMGPNITPLDPFLFSSKCHFPSNCHSEERSDEESQ